VAGPIERRQAPRFGITVPVKLEHGTGITRNISTSGVFFETDQAFSPGTPIQLTLLLEPSRLHCQGEIVRVEGLEGKMGVAVAFKSYQFETLGGGSR